MPLAGKGMLLTSMDIDPTDEADFNRWYDREHLMERVAIDGFLEARRYIAHQGSPKYLCLYSTETFERARQPGLSRRPDESHRLVEDESGAFQEHDPRGRTHHDQPRTGPRRGARHRPPSSRRRQPTRDCARRCARSSIPSKLDGIISMHLIESDPALSKPLTDDPPVSRPRRRRLVRPDRCHRCERASRRDRRALHRIGRARRGNKDIVGQLSSDVGSGADRTFYCPKSMQMKLLQASGICCSATCIARH